MSNKLRPSGLILPWQANNTRVRNTQTGRIFPCCYADCEVDGSTRYEYRVPHENPRWPGEMVVYIFCSESHRAMFAAEFIRPKIQNA